MIPLGDRADWSWHDCLLVLFDVRAPETGGKIGKRARARVLIPPRAAQVNCEMARKSRGSGRREGLREFFIG